MGTRPGATCPPPGAGPRPAACQPRRPRAAPESSGTAPGLWQNPRLACTLKAASDGLVGAAGGGLPPGHGSWTGPGHTVLTQGLGGRCLRAVDGASPLEVGHGGLAMGTCQRLAQLLRQVPPVARSSAACGWDVLKGCFRTQSNRKGEVSHPLLRSPVGRQLCLPLYHQCRSELVSGAGSREAGASSTSARWVHRDLGALTGRRIRSAVAAT